MSKVQNIENKILIILIILAAVVMFVLGYIWTLKPNENEIKIEDTSEISLEENEEPLNVVTNLGIEEDENLDIESASSSIGNKVEDLETANNSNNQTSQSNNSQSTTTNEKTQNIEEKEPTFIMPVNGDIIKGFAKENLVYSETLQEWIVHQAIDIKAQARDVVKAAAEGTVKAIKNDPRYGLTVIVEHSAGFQTVYSNLLTAEYVVEGEKVKQGQTLGTVGNSAVFEISDDTHLHFEMLKNSEYADPSLYIK